MDIIAVSGNESRIVKIGSDYYCITDYETVNSEELESYHAFALQYFNSSWWKPDLNHRYLIDRTTGEITEDPYVYPDPLIENIVFPINDSEDIIEETEEENE